MYSPQDASPFPLWYSEVKETKLPYTGDPLMPHQCKNARTPNSIKTATVVAYP